MVKKLSYVLVCLLSISCGGSDDDQPADNGSGAGSDSASTKFSIYAATQDELPTCETSNDDQMAYVSGEYSWFACDAATSSWSQVLSQLNITEYAALGGVTGDFDESADIYNIVEGSRFTYINGDVLFNILATKTYNATGYTDYINVTKYIPADTVSTFGAQAVVLGEAYRNSATINREVFLLWDGTDAKIYSNEDGGARDSSDTLLSTTTWTSIEF